MITDHVKFYNTLHMVGIVSSVGRSLDIGALDDRCHGWAVVENDLVDAGSNGVANFFR